MKFKRRRYVVNKSLQVRYTLFFVISCLLGSIIATIAFNYLALKKFEALIWRTHINVKTTGEIVKPIFMYINAIDTLFVSILLIIIGILMIRKTAGPIYRMITDIMKVANGDLSVDITLRQKDEFKDVANELNNMVRNLRGRLKVISEKYSGISRSIERYKALDSKEGLESIYKNIKTVEEEINKIIVRGN